MMQFYSLFFIFFFFKAIHCKSVPDFLSINLQSKLRPGDGDNDDGGEDSESDESPKRLVLYFNFEHPKMKSKIKVTDKSGYENGGTLTEGGEILKFSDPDFSCEQGARLYSSAIKLRGDTVQAKPKEAVTIAAWVKLDETAGTHYLFQTIGANMQGQYHFEVDDGIVRWFHQNEELKTVYETMAHSVSAGKWTHLAGTYDSKLTLAKIFINGVLRNQSTGEGFLSSDWSKRAEIGDSEKCGPLKGSIDEFRIYNYALKPDEIQALVKACLSDDGKAKLDKAEAVQTDKAEAAQTDKPEAAQTQKSDVSQDAQMEKQGKNASSRTLASTKSDDKEESKDTGHDSAKGETKSDSTANVLKK